jgi:hypothetical protein
LKGIEVFSSEATVVRTVTARLHPIYTFQICATQICTYSFPLKGCQTCVFRRAGATAGIEVDTEKHMDGRAMREQVLKLGAERQDGFVDDKIYRGMNSYVDHRAGFRKVGGRVTPG